MFSIHTLLQSGNNKLQNLETPSLDVEVLLSFVLKKPREYLLAHGEDEVSPEQEQQFHALIAERAKHKPIAYLTKHKEFYGRDFYVDERVHIPRPATEDLIDYIKEKIPKNFSGTMADIGTGSGCIAITLALEFPNAKIIATDISEDALNVARQNALIYISEASSRLAHKGQGFPLSQPRTRFAFCQGNLLEPIDKPVDIIISNPPYGWPEGWSNDPEVAEQPRVSYDGGADGLDIIKQLLNELPKHLAPSGQAFIKFDPRRKAEVVELLEQSPFSWKIKQDLAGWDRIVHLTYK